MITSLEILGTDREKRTKLINYEKELFKHYDLLKQFVCTEEKSCTFEGNNAEEVISNFHNFIRERKNHLLLGNIRNLQVNDLTQLEGNVSITCRYEEFVLISKRKLRLYRRIEKGYFLVLNNIEEYKEKNNIKNII